MKGFWGFMLLECKKDDPAKGVLAKGFYSLKNIGIVWRNPAMPIFSVYRAS
jgi:hypothetical protein